MSPPPLVILGIDAGDPELIERAAAAGAMPTVAAIMDGGAWGRTGGPELISEHGVWVSIFSGISRGEHGYYSYRQLRPGSYDLESVTGADLDAPRFWAHLRHRAIATLDVPDTDPIRGLRGLQLAHWASHYNWDPVRFAPAAEPAGLLTEVQPRFGRQLLTVERHDSSEAEDRRLLGDLVERVRIKGAMTRHVLAGGRFDLVVVVFAESHVANHQFWRYGPWAATEPAPADLSGATLAVYQAIDAELGRLLATLPAERDVVVVSSVGMTDDFPTTGLVDSFCRRLGYQAAPDGAAAPRRPIDLLRRVVPESWRVAASRRIHSRARREALLAEQFRRATDWSRTTAFAIPAAYTSFVRVNLRGREPQGTVAAGAEYDDILRRLEEDFRLLVDPSTGERAVERVSRSDRLFGTGPPVSLPDLFVDWTPGRYVDRVVHPRAEIVQQRPDFFRRSDHSTEGFFAAAGPSIRRRGRIGAVAVLDLAPTFLTLMGEPVPERLRGRPIEGIP